MGRSASRLLGTALLLASGFAWGGSTAIAAGATPAPTKAIAAGGLHTCALSTTGTVRCWGSNQFGQLGDGTLTNATTPVAVTGLSGVKQIVAGQNHSCALLTTGAVKCWGENNDGQLGNGTLTNAKTPVAVSGVVSAASISAGWFHTCAVLKAHTVKCWGLNNKGQIGNGTTTNAKTPVMVSGLTAIGAVAAGGYHTCSLGSHTVKCWGDNSFGQLGAGTVAANATRPVVTIELAKPLSITSGGYHTCSIVQTRVVKCWGRGTEGQLGQERFKSEDVPYEVKYLTGVKAVFLGGYHSCATLTANKKVRCWGQATYGATGLGIEGVSDTGSISVAGLTDATGVATGVFHSCAVRTNHTTVCWGRNDKGQLGNGTTTEAQTPVPVTGA